MKPARRRRAPRLVHLSDLHLGFRAFPDSERGWNRREADLVGALRWAVREIVRLAPDLVLLTGDLFDHPDPPTTAHLALHRALQTLRSRLPETTVLAVAGERDSPANPAASGPLAVLDMLPGVEAATGAPRAVRIRRLGVHALLVPHRASHTPPFPSVRPDPEAEWNLLLVRGVPRVAGSARGSGAARRSRPALEVRASEWDYVAVGGPHTRGEWAPNVHAAGSLERPGRDPWRFATEERGFLSVELATGEVEFHAVPGRAVVDLAPVRLTPGDPEAGTRRFRELLDGIPGGVDGKIVRARFEGDVVAPDEGVSAALLSAVRRRASHLEVRLSGRTRGRPTRPTRGKGRRGARDAAAVRTLRLLGPAGEPVQEVPLERGLVLLTSDSEETRVRLVGELGGGSAGRRRTVPGPDGRWTLALDPPPPGEGGAGVVWAGRDVWHEYFAEGIGEADGERPTEPAPGVPKGDLGDREAALSALRMDAIEAFGDLEARSLEWARERQDAESHLSSYRQRARELRRRLRSFEIEGEDSTCPTCGRPMAEEYERVVAALREEWETLVQDGRWWARRREQLEEKPDDLRKLEESAFRLNALVEQTGEEIERLKERARIVRGEGGEEGRGRDRDPDARRFGTAFARDLLREAGSILNRLTDGRTLGLRVEEGELRVVGSDGASRSPEHGEEAAILGALHAALWMRARSGPGSDAASGGAPHDPGGGRPLLLWEFLETGAAEIACSAIEAIGGLHLREDDFVVAVVPPAVLERLPEVYALALDLERDERGRWKARRIPGGVPEIVLGR